MWDIIHKWGNPNISPQTYIFKYAKGNEDAFEKIKLVRRIVTKCNRKLKKIAQGTGIAQLTTYTARHYPNSFPLKTNDLQRIVS